MQTLLLNNFEGFTKMSIIHLNFKMAKEYGKYPYIFLLITQLKASDQNFSI